ncbi:hypothetical protein H6G97_39400 [Nostoc flagelliforme FACHB-838]|uniref:Transposase n=1 Tax=Nostoc flagelliforme FACHB-838 TaxID=2692904 RepID=A0ABR8E3E0_9NOSO|nr:hypothetical protein [Nostoc flagelliforme FACHB-838]
MLLTRVIHVFDREGDIAEVFALQRKNKNTGIVVRAAHNRCLAGENSYLWEYVISLVTELANKQGVSEVPMSCQNRKIPYHVYLTPQ